jgi:ADP-ribose pyrophosphatase
MIRPWPVISSKPVGDFRIFTIRSDVKRSPRTGREHDFYIIDCVNWVNVIAVTPQRELVMIEQYRHGSNTVELEVPGGMMDRHETSPVAAGERELRGEIFPNPAIMSNKCYTVLVENCRCEHAVEFDHGEDIVTRLVPIAEIPRLIASGKIGHSMVVVALTHFELLQRGVK